MENFVSLADGTKTGKPFYDGTVFHRVIPNFMIQGGDPGRHRTRRPRLQVRRRIPSLPEAHASRACSPWPIAGPNTNGSQFFVTVAATPWLDNKHSIFGEVVEGYDVVKKISEVPRSAQDRPAEGSSDSTP